LKGRNKGDAYLSREQNKLLIRRYIEEIINTGNTDGIERFISPDYTEVYENARHLLGIDGAKQHVLGVRRTYADLHLTVEHQIAEGDWVVTQITARGTHRGEWLGIRPTGKAVQFTGVNINRIENGLIVEHGGAANLLEPLLKIGAVKLAGPEGK
jgi:predicted ester cyclase